MRNNSLIYCNSDFLKLIFTFVLVLNWNFDKSRECHNSYKVYRSADFSLVEIPIRGHSYNGFPLLLTDVLIPVYGFNPLSIVFYMVKGTFL